MKEMTGKSQNKKPSRGGLWFLAVVMILHLVTAVIAPDKAGEARQAAWHMIKSIAPILGLVFVLIFLSNLLLQERWIQRFVGTSSGVRGYLVSAVAGTISAGPVYVWYPLLQDMRTKGMKDALIAVFLYNRAVKPQWMPVLIGYFGLRYTLVLSFWMILGGFVQGLVFEAMPATQSQPGPASR